MCLAIPAQVNELLADSSPAAIVDILGVRRKVSLELLRDDPPALGDWVLIHVGFAMSKISPQQADEQLRMLASLGEASAAREELAGSAFDGDEFAEAGPASPARPAPPASVLEPPAAHGAPGLRPAT